MNKGYIYTIVSRITNKSYVGSTTSFKRREKTHLRKLRKGIHENNHLQNLFNKYGESDLSISILEVVSKDEMIDKEQQLINTGKYVLNIALTVKQPPYSKGRKTSEETKQKIRKARLGSKHSEETKLKMSRTRKGKRHSLKAKENMSILNPRSKVVMQYDLEGNLIEEFRSKNYATRVTGIHLDSVLSGRTKTAGGFRWKHKTDCTNNKE